MATNGIHPATNGATHNPLVHDYPKPLKIAVVGAGLGGLSAAIALRRQGHEVNIYEQSRFANETGAAVHLAPNSNGVLRRWGVFAERFGGVAMNTLVEHKDTGELVKEVDLSVPNRMWQHPWHLVHRVALHENLKSVATSKEGPGPTPTLQTASRVTEVDAEGGKITFQDGTTAEVDVIVGADGIYSRTRNAVDGGKSKLFGSGKAAFRFLISRKVALEDPVTKPLVEKNNTLSMWYGSDRRIVMYPCNDNETLNFVLIHPDTESHATPGDEWNKQGSVEQVLKVYQNFDPAVKHLISKVDPAELKVWQLLDMDKLPTWTKGKLALIGDAAHPFTPHQGQGAGQAMEDAAALATVLPLGTAPSDVPERLKVYEKIRYDRGHAIQEYSRQAGRDWVNGKPQIDTLVMSYTAYNFGHDEIDNSANVFKRWLWSQKKDMFWRMPIGFGPFPGPRQDHLGRPRGGQPERTFVTASIKFKTSRTYLETLFPTSQYKFASPATVCQASISITQLGNMSWLGGGGYNHCGLYIHGVQYTKKDGTSMVGTHLPVLFESLTDPIVSGRDELGMNKVFCDVDIQRDANNYKAQCSWRGAKFLDFELGDLKADDVSTETGTIGGEADYGILTYKYIPAVGEPGKADIEYACVVPHEEEARLAPATVKAVARSVKPTLKFDAGDWQGLPTLHHITAALAEIPIYEIKRHNDTAEMASEHKANDLPKVERYITDHNSKGEAIFSSAIPTALPTQTILNGVVFGLGYATKERPVRLTDEADINAYKPLIANPPGIVIPGGTVARYVDTPPDSVSPMHRTVSLDYGVVIEGEVELILDSGETRMLKRGDLVVQRGTMHAWRNPSKTEWNRMLYFLQESEPVLHEGKRLEEEYGEMGEEVQKSGN
ncbi:hypothetical protein SCAR479_06313 [Seiridium cardinale]|uniref:FAD-binding domain-containing protein n=1 Tax=Seiridium cardinale TaxID=138064 RepID=A0ABR2XT39_9PEZI